MLSRNLQPRSANRARFPGALLVVAAAMLLLPGSGRTEARTMHDRDFRAQLNALSALAADLDVDSSAGGTIRAALRSLRAEAQ